jgi:hypothetical protein
VCVAKFQPILLVYRLYGFFCGLLGMKAQVFPKTALGQGNKGESKVAFGSREPIFRRTWRLSILWHNRVPFRPVEPDTGRVSDLIRIPARHFP